MAGHSKWSNIKHRKGAQDAKRGKLNTRLIREVMVATKAGGPDKNTNAILRLAVERAFKANITKDSLDRAILKASGQLQGEQLDELSYEGYASGGVALWVHCLTDNRNRTVAEVRHLFTKHGASLGAEGSVSYLFERVGHIVCAHQNADVVLETVIDFDVESVESVEAVDSDTVCITLSPSGLNEVCEYLSKNTDWEILDSGASYNPTASVALPEDGIAKVEKMIEALESLDDVQSVYTNLSTE